MKVYLAKNDVAVVEVGQRAQSDEELRPVAIRDLKVRHREEKRFVVLHLTSGRRWLGK